MTRSNRQSRPRKTSSSRPIGCPDDDTLAAWLTTSHRVGSEITAHVEQCFRCERLAVRFAELFAVSTRSSASTRLDHALPLAPGTPVGRYTIRGMLGRGGFGTVYAALDTTLRRAVALKIMHPSEGAEAILRREARALASISHPNIVEVFDVGMLGDHPFIAMELVDGPTLRTLVRVQRLGWSEIRSLLLDAGRALAAAHDHGLVHGDFKPDNVLCGHDGRVRVTDFGIGVLTGVAPQRVAGTRAYAPPGSDARWGSAIDVYAWAASLVELVERGSASRPPRRRRVAVGTDPFPRHVRAILHRCLACADPASMPSMKEVLAVMNRPAHRRWARVMVAISIGAVAAVIGRSPSAPAPLAEAHRAESASTLDSRWAALDASILDSDMRAAVRLSERLLRDPTVMQTPALAARAHLGLGQALLGQDPFDPVAESRLRTALELADQVRDVPTRIRALIGLHMVRRHDFTTAEAYDLARRIEVELAELGDDPVAAELRQAYWASVADSKLEAGAFDEAARLYDRALAASPSSSPARVGQIVFLGRLCRLHTHAEAAEPALRRAIDELRTNLGPHHRAVIIAHETYAWYLASHGRIDDAATELAAAVSGWNALLGGLGQSESTQTELLLGELDIKFGLRDADPARTGRGLARMNEVVERTRRRRGDRHIATAKLRIRALGQRAMAGELESMLRDAERLRVDLQAIDGSGSPLLHQVSLMMAHALLELGHLQRAERELRGLLDASDGSPARVRTRLPAYLYLAAVLWELDRRDEACGHALTALLLAEALGLDFGREKAIDRLSRCGTEA